VKDARDLKGFDWSKKDRKTGLRRVLSLRYWKRKAISKD
jgi:hypothetical protein